MALNDKSRLVIKQSQAALSFVAIKGASPNVIKYHSLLPGIVFDTREGVGVLIAISIPERLSIQPY